MFHLKDIHPDIVEKAIDLVATGEYTFSCNALGSAALDFEHYYPEREIIRQHYERHVCRITTPDWWGSSDEYIKERVEALESFKQAVLKARDVRMD